MAAQSKMAKKGQKKKKKIKAMDMIFSFFILFG